MYIKINDKIIISQMKQRKQSSHNEKQTSSLERKIVKNNHNQHTNRHQKHSVSVIYESGRNSFTASPRAPKNLDKYKTYMQFITNNKVNCQEFKMTKQDIMAIKKNIGTPIPRKNSPVPYSKGRRSAFSKPSQPQSPTSLAQTHRNSFPKSQDAKQTKKQNNPNLTFVVTGNNVQKVSNRRKHVSVEQQNGKNYRRELSKGEESTEGVMENKGKGSDNMRRLSLQSNNSKNKNKDKDMESRKLKSKLVPASNKAKGKNKNSLDSNYTENLDKQQQKLCEKLFKGIQFHRDLGRGAHALVRSAVDWNNKRKIAIKIYQKSQLTQQQVRSIQREIQILMSLSHPNIIKLYQIIETHKTINLIMQYGGGNSLDQYIKNKTQGYLPQRQVKLIFKQILDAVKYLHEMNITHRDIKTQNILLNKHLQLKIIDFGFSLVVSNNKMINSYCGTPTYMAPEVVSKTPHNPLLADRWSLGVLLFNMLNGHCPFRASTQKDLFVKINKGQYEYSREVNEGAKDLISRLLVKVPQDRLSPKQALTHPWLIDC